MTTDDTSLNELPDKAAAILRYLREYITRHDYPPTRREIMDATGISSTAVVQYNLNILADYNHIYLHPNVSRGIGLRTPGQPISNVPER